MLVAETFKALGDPVRLEILLRLADGSSHNVGSLLNGLGLTRQGASKHLQVLVRADLVLLQKNGRKTGVILDATSLATAKSFITDLEKCWDHRLQSLREFVENDISTKSPY